MSALKDIDDSKPIVVPWTVPLALRAARVDRSLSVKEQRKQVRAAVDAEELPPQVVALLRGAGWLEGEG